MSISIGNSGYDSFISTLNIDNAKSKASEAASLESKLSKGNLKDASDEELMEVCKTFESYLLEKILEKTKKTLTDSEEEENSPYMNMFGDRLYQEYADQITEHGELGLAQQLFEAMKRDFGTKVKVNDSGT
ncbi:MAG: rod-binding protein [Lachnospiraceae bacterium]|nr:rod-binding protein [Lachnospiraceae bacterium]